MQQYFIEEKLHVDDIYHLDDEIRHHFINVLRMRENEEFYLVDGTSTRFLMQLINKQSAKVISQIDYNSELPNKVTIVQALIKKDKFDIFLMKASELGAARIVPLNSKRCIIKLDEMKKSKLDRWQKICFDACCQCKRNQVTEITEVIKLKDINQFKSDINLVAYEDLNYPSVKLRDVITSGKSVTIVIGPEGGFDLDEIKYLTENGFDTLSLGKRILRAETASLYALSVISGLQE